MKKKICTNCKVDKELNDFHKAKNGKFGVRSECKNCSSKYAKSRKVDYNPNAFKVCGGCKVEKSTTLFSKDKKGVFGVTSQCKSCEREYYESNKESRLVNAKEYRENNKDKRNKRTKERKKTDTLFKLTCSLRGLIYKSLKRGGFDKNTKTAKILGCSYEEFKAHIESQFEDWMSWENQGKYNGELKYGWDLDHIIPLASAKTEDERVKLNHYTNFQPLCSYYNRYIKRDKINY